MATFRMILLADVTRGKSMNIYARVATYFILQSVFSSIGPKVENTQSCNYRPFITSTKKQNFNHAADQGSEKLQKGIQTLSWKENKILINYKWPRNSATLTSINIQLNNIESTSPTASQHKDGSHKIKEAQNPNGLFMRE